MSTERVSQNESPPGVPGADLPHLKRLAARSKKDFPDDTWLDADIEEITYEYYENGAEHCEQWFVVAVNTPGTSFLIANSLGSDARPFRRISKTTKEKGASSYSNGRLLHLGYMALGATVVAGVAVLVGGFLLRLYQEVNRKPAPPVANNKKADPPRQFGPQKKDVIDDEPLNVRFVGMDYKECKTKWGVHFDRDTITLRKCRNHVIALDRQRQGITMEPWKNGALKITESVIEKIGERTSYWVIDADGLLSDQGSTFERNGPVLP